MKCCILPVGDGRKGYGHRDGRGKGSLLGKAAKACKGMKKDEFRKCVKANIMGKVTRKRVTEVPASCKGLKKKARKECAKRVCSQRPAEYREDCYKKAGLKV